MTEDRTLAYIEKEGDLIFHPDFFSKDPKKIKEIESGLQHDESVGWMPPGCGNRSFVIRHEEGHRIWWWILDNEPELGVKISDILLIAARDGVLAEFSKHSVSAGNLAEAFCDVFGAIYCMAPEEQPIFVRLIHRLLKENGIPVKD